MLSLVSCERRASTIKRRMRLGTSKSLRTASFEVFHPLLPAGCSGEHANASRRLSLKAKELGSSQAQLSSRQLLAFQLTAGNRHSTINSQSHAFERGCHAASISFLEGRLQSIFYHNCRCSRMYSPQAASGEIRLATPSI